MLGIRALISFCLNMSEKVRSEYKIPFGETKRADRVKTIYEKKITFFALTFAKMNQVLNNIFLGKRLCNFSAWNFALVQLCCEEFTVNFY